jgi:hypothetical protein
VNKSDHIDAWRTLWSEVCRLPTGRPVSWDRFARESFQLVRVALLYQRNALEMYDDTNTELHGPLRSPDSGVVSPLPWPDKTEPLFPNIMSLPQKMLGGVFVASASFRLPVAVLKAVELSADPFEDMKLLKREGDWHRATLQQFFKNVKSLGCCNGSSSLGSNGSERLRNAITMMMVHRDDFGHGEVGQPATDDYKRERERVLDSLHVCRTLEAQRELCEWTLKRLTEKR